ncbi:hypothetical protein ElyMa_004888700 [Elysia marginata]|uniref:BMERB domain-containing protein n=1 Tax=Elysia marginata TaxID=1093978 RepID=A0AAV4ITX3_9GAST|nr:hypothetical protein ElyMa_004888700 [Elysia marginata]
MSFPTPALLASTERRVSETDNKQDDGDDGTSRHLRKISGSTRVSLDRETLADSGVGSEEPGETVSVAGDDVRVFEHQDIVHSSPQNFPDKSNSRSRDFTISSTISKDALHSLAQTETSELSENGAGWGGGVDGRKSGSDSAVSVTSTGTNWPASFGVESRLVAFSSPTMSEGSKVSASSSPHRRSGSPPKRSMSPELSRSVRRKQERRRRELDIQETRVSLRKHQIGKAKSEAESGAKLLEQIMAASSKPSGFHSLSTIRSMEQRYGRKSQRSRGDRIKVARSYESKSTSPTPMAEPDSGNRTKVGFSRSIQNQPASRRSGKRSKSLEKSSASRMHKVQPAPQELSSPRGENTTGRSITIPISRSFPSPPPLTSSPRGPMESPDLDDSLHDNSGIVVTDGIHSRSQSSSYSEAKSSSAAGNSRRAQAQVENGIGQAEVTSEELERRTLRATDAILRDGLPDIPPLIKLHASLVGKSLTSGGTADTPGPPNGVRARDTTRLGDQLKDLERNMQLYQKKQDVIDLETELLAKEEQLSEKQQNLEEYEKEARNPIIIFYQSYIIGETMIIKF